MSGSKVRKWVLLSLDVACGIRGLTRGDARAARIARARGDVRQYPFPPELFKPAQIKRRYGRPQILPPIYAQLRPPVGRPKPYQRYLGPLVNVGRRGP